MCLRYWQLELTSHEIALNRTAFNQSHENNRVDIQNCVQELAQIVISKCTRKQLHDRLASVQMRIFHAQEGKRGYSSISATPFVSVAARFMQQLLPSMEAS